jgi:hypothetical protein
MGDISMTSSLLYLLEPINSLLAACCCTRGLHAPYGVPSLVAEESTRVKLKPFFPQLEMEYLANECTHLY